MLIENTQPCWRCIGNINLRPGVNRVDTELWDVNHPEYKESIDLLLESGVLVMHEDKVTSQLIKKCFDPEVLRSWAFEVKSVQLRKAIDDQLKLFEIKAEVEAEADGVS